MSLWNNLKKRVVAVLNPENVRPLLFSYCLRIKVVRHYFIYVTRCYHKRLKDGRITKCKVY